MKPLGFFVVVVVALVTVSGTGPRSTAAAQKEGADQKGLEKFQGKWAPRG